MGTYTGGVTLRKEKMEAGTVYQGILRDLINVAVPCSALLCRFTRF